MRLAVMAALVMLVGCGGTGHETAQEELCGTLTLAQCEHAIGTCYAACKAQPAGAAPSCACVAR